MLLDLRRRILTPRASAATMAERGFYRKSAESVGLLETVGQSFITGFGYAAGAATVAAAGARLETVDGRFRGFAYEGAAMAYAVLDGWWLGGRRNSAAFLAGPGDRHIYMAYIGIGWACARLPRWRWRAVCPTDPLLRWLVLDGYGFHQAYFHTGKYVRDRYQAPALPSPFDHPGDYVKRATDHGIGRAMWFVGGADTERVAAAIDTFPQRRRADLWSGAGLAATYAGGANESELRGFWKLAGPYRPVVAQASAFAAEARVRADLVTEHTHLATGVFCGMSPPDAASVTHSTRQDLPVDGSIPAYEIWRQRTADQFASFGRC